MTDEDEAQDKIERNPPDLILVSLDGSPEDVFASARRIRQRGGLTELTPIVIFSLDTVPEGGEEELKGNVHVTMPDNFNQLRALLTRVLRARLRVTYRSSCHPLARTGRLARVSTGLYHSHHPQVLFDRMICKRPRL